MKVDLSAPVWRSVSFAAAVTVAGCATSVHAPPPPIAEVAGIAGAPALTTSVDWQQRCAAMAQSLPAGLHISAQAAAASPAVAASGNTPAQPALTAHCKLSGKMRERVGLAENGGPRNFHIGFELRLPQNWNGRLLYQGGGGNDGVVRPALGPQATGEVLALNRGFAVVTTDAGHQGPTADFGWDMQARLDNAYAAHDVVAQTAKALVQRHYAKPADKSYFIGCSGGGRQGMMFTQRFPQHFDGVIAMAPAMRVSSGATIAAAWDTQALQAAAPKNAQGQGILSQALSDADLGLIRQGVLAACDAQDGVTDGLVSNPAACQFDIRSLQCSAEKTASCLAAPQVSALQKIFSGAKNSKGENLYFTWPWDAGVGHPANDWRGWKLGTSTTTVANSRHVFLMQDALQGYFITPPTRSLSIYQFNFDTDPARMHAHSQIFDTAADVKLSGYKAKGGKLLFAHGMADPIFSADEMVDYYQRLSKEHGAGTQDFSRLFLIPGMGHCQGGAGTDRWDGLQALVDWVEKGRAPASITASGTAVFPGRSRPLCPYPQYAAYKGSGDVEKAENFSCRQP
jgi:pimeloyl-ACP methyl ester carboxylesterase